MKRREHDRPDARVDHVTAQVHGRFLVRRPIDASHRAWLVGFHGYGDTAAAQLDRMITIPGSDSWLVCSPQALHTFYTSKEAVVASWMTRLDRELAIADNVAYVGRVLDRLEQEYGSPQRLVFAGFSQGAAMAWRAAVRCGRPVHGVIILGGDIPPDVIAELRGQWPVLLGGGTRDEWYSVEKMDAELELLGKAGVDVTASRFEGGHEWSVAFVGAAGDFLRRVARD